MSNEPKYQEGEQVRVLFPVGDEHNARVKTSWESILDGETFYEVLRLVEVPEIVPEHLLEKVLQSAKEIS